eukprot:CAMPEP_0195522164 /NCGR_PEP_ID=MMETSP0794_2-20130614/20080_1 /TAXON_ID=515487 /ORGANISM="Stephanopyxis turris, Strain CCMP 815" /LENGTH=664 /DNA_ID=CAMNT_0040651855 /DNA_START=117 /DNA_END=2111 /DNA_ORIENTATION=+
MLMIFALLLMQCDDIVAAAVNDAIFTSTQQPPPPLHECNKIQLQMCRTYSSDQAASHDLSQCNILDGDEHSYSISLPDKIATMHSEEVQNWLEHQLSLLVEETPLHPKIPSQPHRTLEEEEEKRKPLTTYEIIYNSSLALLCVMIAALAAGLTMGMLSVDPLFLMIKLRCGTPLEKSQAQSIYPLVRQHHRLLVTLLLLNSISNEALPLFLDKLVPGYVAVIISVTLVLIFGEIIPSAVFTGPNQIPMAAHMAPVVRCAMLLLSPVAVPIAKALDAILGHGDGGGGHREGGGGRDGVGSDEDDGKGEKKRDELANTYDRAELSTLVRIMYEQQHNEKVRITRQFTDELKSAAGITGGGGASHKMHNPKPQPNAPQIHIDEVHMVEGALKMKTKIAKDIYTPLQNVFAVSYDAVLDEDTLTWIYSTGYSRIPIYESPPKEEDGEDDDEGELVDISRIRGLLMTRQLIVVDSDDERVVSSMPLYPPKCVDPYINMVDLLNIFQAGGHLAIVCRRPDVGNGAVENHEAIPKTAGVMGIITLEDVIEQLLQESIIDETDRVEQLALRRSKWVIKKWKNYARKAKGAAKQGGDSKLTTGSLHSSITTSIGSMRGGGQTGIRNTPVVGFGDVVNDDMAKSDIESHDTSPLLPNEGDNGDGPNHSSYGSSN